MRIKKRIQFINGRTAAFVLEIMILLFTVGCAQEAENMEKEAGLPIASSADESKIQDEKVLTGQVIADGFQTALPAPDASGADINSADSTEDMEEEVLGKPRSSFGLGSAPFLKGKNILVSIFAATPESSFSHEEQLRALDKLGSAVSYIETKAAEYNMELELLYDWTKYDDLCAEAETDFVINESSDYIELLDEEIKKWFSELISYEELLKKYDAQGIATCVFVNNPGISYAIVYDGTDNEKESIILFTGNYYQKGAEESAATYAHEILHVFGAHDLYEGAEFTKEATDYLGQRYPDEIMIDVSESDKLVITRSISPVTAYHLGWLDYAEEIDRFPQLARD